MSAKGIVDRIDLLGYIAENDSYYFAYYNLESKSDSVGNEVTPTLRCAMRDKHGKMSELGNPYSFVNNDHQSLSPDKVLYDRAHGIMYILLKPGLVFHHTQACHYIAAAYYALGTPLKPRLLRTFSERDFIEFTPHLRIDDAIMLNNSLIIAISSYGFINITFDAELAHEEFIISGKELNPKYAHFLYENKIERMAKYQNKFYVMFQKGGIMYTTDTTKGEWEFEYMPIGYLHLLTSHIFVTSEYVILSGHHDENKMIIVAQWINGKLTPMYNYAFDHDCRDINRLWMDETTEASRQDGQLMQIFVHCDNSIILFNAVHHPELRVYPDNMENTTEKYNLTVCGYQSAWEGTLNVIMHKEDEQTLVWTIVGIVLGSVVLIGAIVTISIICWKRHQRLSTGLQKKDLLKKDEFLFGEAKSRLSRISKK